MASVESLMRDNRISVTGIATYLAMLGGDPSELVQTWFWLGVVGTVFFLNDYDDHGYPTRAACLAYLEDIETDRTPMWQMPPPYAANQPANWRTGVGCGCSNLVTDWNKRVKGVEMPLGNFTEGMHFDRVRVAHPEW
jgi:hypothetical protein